MSAAPSTPYLIKILLLNLNILLYVALVTEFKRYAHTMSEFEPNKCKHTDIYAYVRSFIRTERQNKTTFPMAYILKLNYKALLF